MNAILSLSFLGLGVALGQAADVVVTDPTSLRAALGSAQAGTRIVVAAGNYGAGYHAANLRGQAGKPIIITAQDAKNPPVFQGGAVGIHLSKPVHVVLENLAFTGQSGNGLNIDDGGAPSEEAGHLTLRGLRIADIGSRGNQDGIKMSGIWNFRIEGCTVERWGTGGGSAIDLVGCHRGVITGSKFRHRDAHGSTGVQCKGGSSEILIQRNEFDDAGGRGVNIGGSTGFAYFRPPLAEGKPHVEARAIRVEGNRFKGSLAPVAFVGVDGAVVRFNTFDTPGKWALRILQENKDPRFVPSRNGEFADNLIIFESARWGEGGVNMSGGVAPETFKFARNWWYCADRPERSQPKLPTPETDGVYGRPVSEARAKAGADAYRE